LSSRLYPEYPIQRFDKAGEPIEKEIKSPSIIFLKKNSLLFQKQTQGTITFTKLKICSLDKVEN